MGLDVFLTATGEKALNRSSFIVELCRYLIGERQFQINIYWIRKRSEVTERLRQDP